MDKLNKWTLDSSWRHQKDVDDQVKIIKSTGKGHKLKVSIKVKIENGWNNIYIKFNRKK